MLTTKVIAAPKNVFVDLHSGNSIIEIEGVTNSQDCVFYFENAVAVRFAASADDINFALDVLLPLRGETNYRFMLNNDTRFMALSAIGGSGYVEVSWGAATRP
jgi:endoglucanase Acf2